MRDPEASYQSQISVLEDENKTLKLRVAEATDRSHDLSVANAHLQAEVDRLKKANAVLERECREIAKEQMAMMASGKAELR